jgi:hypothetical protein
LSAFSASMRRKSSLQGRLQHRQQGSYVGRLVRSDRR